MALEGSSKVALLALTMRNEDTIGKFLYVAGGYSAPNTLVYRLDSHRPENSMKVTAVRFTPNQSFWGNFFRDADHGREVKIYELRST